MEKHYVQIKAANGEYVDLHGPLNDATAAKLRLAETKAKLENGGMKKFELKRGRHEVDA